MSAYVTKPISTCERVSRALSALLSELHFPTRALGPITEARDLLLRAALDANEFYSTERDELTRDVAKLRADLAAAVAERDEWKECAMSNLDERDQLRARLAEYENAPTVAVVWFARNKDGVACSGLDYTDLPPIGTELIDRKVKK